MDIWHVCLLVMASWNFCVAIRCAWKLDKEQRSHRDYRWETSFSEYRLACEENWSRIWMRRCFEERGRAIRYQRQVMAAVDREKARWDERDQLRQNITNLNAENDRYRQHNEALEATNRQLLQGHGIQQ